MHHMREGGEEEKGVAVFITMYYVHIIVCSCIYTASCTCTCV